MRVVCLGAPGSGKGTQAPRFAARHGVPHLSTGEMLREAAARGTPMGRRVADVMASGALVEDALVAAIVGERLGDPDARRGFALDGFPRTMGQAKALEAMLGIHGDRLDLVVELVVDRAVLAGRVAARAAADLATAIEAAVARAVAGRAGTGRT